MFSGIVENCGQVVEAGPTRLVVDGPRQGRLSELAVGDSVSVNGVCLTVCDIKDGQFQADLSQSTCEHTTCGQWDPGDTVNLEPALRVGDALGGHWVSGHVDAVAPVVSVNSCGDSCDLVVRLSADLRPYVALRGSICIDGVSLTVSDLGDKSFTTTLVPHTRAVTVAAGYKAGVWVNLEVDLLARYLQQLLEGREDPR